MSLIDDYDEIVLLNKKLKEQLKRKNDLIKKLRYKLNCVASDNCQINFSTFPKSPFWIDDGLK